MQTIVQITSIVSGSRLFDRNGSDILLDINLTDFI